MPGQWLSYLALNCFFSSANQEMTVVKHYFICCRFNDKMNIETAIVEVEGLVEVELWEGVEEEIVGEVGELEKEDVDSEDEMWLRLQNKLKRFKLEEGLEEEELVEDGLEELVEDELEEGFEEEEVKKLVEGVLEELLERVDEELGFKEGEDEDRALVVKVFDFRYRDGKKIFEKVPMSGKVSTTATHFMYEGFTCGCCSVYATVPAGSEVCFAT